QVVARDAISLTLALPNPGEYVVRVRWSRYVSASSGCMRPAEGGWSEVVVQQPGTVKIEGSLLPHHCCPAACVGSPVRAPHIAGASSEKVGRQPSSGCLLDKCVD